MSKPSARMRFAPWLVAIAAVAVMVLVGLRSGPVDVSEGDCVRLWNATSPAPDGLPPPETPTWLLAEDEQDLGYGLCSLSWKADDGRCRTVSTPVWKDSNIWEASAASYCDVFDLGQPVDRDGNDLVLATE